MQTSLLKPKIIAVEPLGDHHAKVVMEPFERGTATPGQRAAPRAAVVDGRLRADRSDDRRRGARVLHLDGVQEDVVNLLLNLKGVVFKLHNRDEVTVTLRKEGEGVVTAGDIELRTTSKSSTRSRDRHLSKGGKLDMQIKVEKGRGYVPGNVRRYGDDGQDHRPHRAGRLVLAGSPRELRGRKRVSSSVPTWTSW
jgi:DNA-directed RNA polymerase subunit alpha